MCNVVVDRLTLEFGTRDRQTDRQTGRQRRTEAERQTETDRQRQTDRQTETEREREIKDGREKDKEEAARTSYLSCCSKNK